MIITAGILIGIMSTAIEAKLVNSIPALRRWYENGLGPIPGAWFNNGFSFLLGMALGGGTTIIAMMGGLFGVFFSNVYFGLQKSANNAGWNSDRVRQEASAKGQLGMKWWTANKVHFENLAKTIMLMIKIVTFPVRGAIAVNTTLQNGKGALYAKKQEFQEMVGRTTTNP